jgi:hypothetical protein
MKVGPEGGRRADGQRQLDKNFGVATSSSRAGRRSSTSSRRSRTRSIPTFWAAQAEKIMGHDKLKPKGRGDIIEVRKPDSGLYAELLVTEIGTGFIKTVLVRSAEPPAVEVPEGRPLATKWNAGTKMHDVVRKTDNQVMRAGFQTKAAAAAWIATTWPRSAA